MMLHVNDIVWSLCFVDYVDCNFGFLTHESLFIEIVVNDNQ